MTASRRHRPQSHQPQLPLPSSGNEQECGPDEEWRLDDQTRQIGRRGVALARAQLGGTYGNAGPGGAGGTAGTGDTGRKASPGGDPCGRAGSTSGRQSGSRGPTGRAA